jgi:hypothetical protein
MSSKIHAKATSLYRYMGGWKWFKAAIKQGEFTPRVSDEDFSWLTSDGKPWQLMMPMVSFCDIPLERSKYHRGDYGDYVIGLSKEWGMRAGLNPLLYINDSSDMAVRLVRRFSRLITKSPLVADDFKEAWSLMPYLKPCIGDQVRAGRRNQAWRHSICVGIHFEQEMEWRYVPQCWEGIVQSLPSASFAERETLNRRCSHDRLKFNDGDVMTIVVNTPGQRVRLHRMRPNLKGKVKLWGEIGG